MDDGKEGYELCRRLENPCRNPMFIRIAAPAAVTLALTACGVSPLPPPVVLPKGGKAGWNRSITYWDRNGDGKADRIRNYHGSGYAREYFDDRCDGEWDGLEHAAGGKLATGALEKRAPGGLTDQDRKNIEASLKHCIPSA